MATSTPTPIELSKALQEQILAAIKQSQEIALGGVELWATAVAPFAKTRREPVRGRPPQARRSRRQLVRLRREAARVAEGVRAEGRRNRRAGPEREARRRHEGLAPHRARREGIALPAATVLAWIPEKTSGRATSRRSAPTSAPNASSPTSRSGRWQGSRTSPTPTSARSSAVCTSPRSASSARSPRRSTSPPRPSSPRPG